MDNQQLNSQHLNNPHFVSMLELCVKYLELPVIDCENFQRKFEKLYQDYEQTVVSPDEDFYNIHATSQRVNGNAYKDSSSLSACIK